MSEQYNLATAAHYASFRPPLHGLILEYVLSSADVFNKGLDVGCGTGYSAIALAKYCSQVHGIDPSRSMLEKARPHEKITYHQGTGNNVPLPDKSVDVVTFAGSLFYAKSEMLIKELKRVCLNQALIIHYDFEVLIEDVLVQCGINPEKTKSNYDHLVNFSDCDEFIELVIGSKQSNLELTASELAHILLSSSICYEAFLEKYDVSDPFPVLVKKLERTKDRRRLKVNIYYSKYRFSGH